MTQFLNMRMSLHEIQLSNNFNMDFTTVDGRYPKQLSFGCIKPVNNKVNYMYIYNI